MKPQDPKALKAYCKRKGGLFEETAKLKCHKKLNQIVTEFNQHAQGRHARHICFFSPVSQSLDTVDHLILTTKGFILIEQVPTLKYLSPLDDQWWQHEKTGQLLLNETYRLKQTGRRLNECLALEGINELPIFPLVVSDKSFIQDVYTLEQVLPRLQELMTPVQPVIGAQDLQKIEKILTQNMTQSLNTKLNHYDPTWVHTQYNPLPQLEKKVLHPLLGVYQTMNEWIQEEAPEATLFHEVPLEDGYIKTVMVCQKGLVLFDYLDAGSQVKVEVDQINWTLFKEQQGQWQQSVIPNPVKRLDQQTYQLKKTLNAPVPITYRVIGLHPIDLEFKHPSLALELHLKPALSNCQQEQPQVLNEVQLLWVKQQLSHLIA